MCEHCGRRIAWAVLWVLIVEAIGFGLPWAAIKWRQYREAETQTTDPAFTPDKAR